MLPKRSRLTSAEVRSILTKGASVRQGSVGAKYIAAPGSKAAVVVSSKVARLATQRNMLRRRAYATLRGILPPKKHVVFFVHSKAATTEDFTHLCSKLS